MRKIFINIFTGSALLFAAFLQTSAQEKDLSILRSERHNLMPVPASVEWKSGRMALTKSFSVAVKGQTDERLMSYIDRVIKRLESRTVLEFSRELSNDAAQANLLIETASTGSPVPKLGDDESYNLEIANNQAKLTAPNTVGAMRGLETFLQLLEADKNGFYFPSVSIADKPRFPWRGLLIDVARHYEPMEVLKRNLDAMAAVKLNVLHWHLTEDQGFRVESKKFPRLHQFGSDGLFYTQEDIKEIIKYAADRGIRVVPEFDMPGHATAWLVGHPELGSVPGATYKIERGAGIFEPALDPTREEVYKFLDGFLGEMAGLFPDAYLHIGGDENEGKQWERNAQIQAFMKAKNLKDHQALQTYFNRRVLKILQKHNKIMMGWDEIFQPDLPKNVVIHSWRGQKSLAEAARQGYQGVLSNGYYIDLMYPASQHYAVDPLPADTNLSADEQKRILGGEATMWSEWVSPETIDGRIWMRTAAIAERFWSPREVKNTEDMYRRLEAVSLQLEDLGLRHRKNQAVLLRRLAGSNNDISALQTLVSVIEPVKEYQRYQLRPQTMLSPLTGLIDAAQPDAEAARNFNKSVDEMLAGSDTEKSEKSQKIRQILIDWREAANKLQTQMENSPALAEAKPLAADLQNLSEIGLEALTMTQPKTDEWHEKQLAALDQIAKPKAALEFPVVSGVRKMVDAAFALQTVKK